MVLEILEVLVDQVVLESHFLHYKLQLLGRNKYKVLINYAGDTSQALLCDAHFFLRFLVFLVGLDHLDHTRDISFILKL